MSEMDKNAILNIMKLNLDELIAFADREKDFLLGAKLEDARLCFAKQYISID